MRPSRGPRSTGTGSTIVIAHETKQNEGNRVTMVHGGTVGVG